LKAGLLACSRHLPMVWRCSLNWGAAPLYSRYSRLGKPSIKRPRAASRAQPPQRAAEPDAIVRTMIRTPRPLTRSVRRPTTTPRRHFVIPRGSHNGPAPPAHAWTHRPLQDRRIAAIGPRPCPEAIPALDASGSRRAALIFPVGLSPFILGMPLGAARPVSFDGCHSDHNGDQKK
jgi:hypothetical protein